LIARQTSAAFHLFRRISSSASGSVLDPVALETSAACVLQPTIRGHAPCLITVRGDGLIHLMRQVASFAATRFDAQRV
jgi:hypothetical protein